MTDQSKSNENAHEELEIVLRDTPFNISTICKVAKKLHAIGDENGVERAFNHCATLLRKLAKNDKVDDALRLEEEIYISFVKLVETEENYHRCFSLWKDDLEKMGSRFRSATENGARSAKPNKNIAVVLPVGIVLGHTEVLFRMMEAKPDINLKIYLIDSCTRDFVDRCRELNIGIVQCPMPTTTMDIVERLTWLRDRLEADNFHCVIWLSTPAYASFILSMRLAPVQIFWALRFHPLALADIDGYITYGAWSETTREFWGQQWQVCPVPLALTSKPPLANAIADVRSKFPQKFLFGTLAREEKIDSKPFLICVVEILKRNPDTGFLWTGKSRHAGIERVFQEHGVADRCHFIGWVDSQLYAASLDVFLETFPLGCGITGYQALAAGVPVLSYLATDTVFGMQYWSELANSTQDVNDVAEETLQQYPLLVARDQNDYVSKATRLFEDCSYRQKYGASGRQFFETELNNSSRYSDRFFQTILSIAEKKLQTKKKTKRINR